MLHTNKEIIGKSKVRRIDSLRHRKGPSSRGHISYEQIAHLMRHEWPEDKKYIYRFQIGNTAGIEENSKIKKKSRRFENIYIFETRTLKHMFQLF